MPNIEQENNQSETQPEERLKLLKAKDKTPLEKAQEKLRRARSVEEEKTINEPQAAQEQPSPATIPARTEPTQPTPSPAPTLRVSEEQAKQELEQALKKQPDLKEAIEPQKPEAEKEIKPSLTEKPEAVPLQDKDEKLELLKREEIKTMQKDIKSLRELEAKKERERVVGLQAEKKKPKIEQEIKPEPIKPEPVKKALPEEILIPKPPKRPSALKKVFVRVGIFVLVVFIISFAYWFLSQKQELDIDQETPFEEEQETIEEVEEPEISIPKSLITVKNTLTFNATNSENIKNIYSQITTQELTENEFVRIIIKNEEEKYLLSLNEIAQAFQITIPAEILENLEADTLNLLVYSQEHGKRGVVIAEIKDKEKLKTALTSWENNTITNGLLVSGNKIPTASVKFKDYAFENVSFRFLTVSINDLGICYVLFDDYFALSTSFKSIEQTIKALKEQKTPEEEIPEPEVSVPSVIERILNWGYHLPITRTIDTIIIHSVYNALGGDVHDVEKVIEEYQIYRVAAHYLITRDGIIYRLVPDEAIAYHAGVSKMPDNRVNVNDFSIGIEIINTKAESPTEIQYQTLYQLVKYLHQQYNIPLENVLGHKDIAPERKTDPWNFDWEYFQSLLYE